MDYHEIRNNGRLVVDSTINGKFEGFNRDKLFELANGQYWIQSIYKYWYHYAYRPKVKIFNYGNRFYLIPEGTNNFVEVKKINDVIKGTIVNNFNGWSGNTLFELDNGQIWKQAEYDYDYNYSYRPEAIIYSVGFEYRLMVEGKAVAVKRVR
jgi:hypothetical protein